MASTSSETPSLSLSSSSSSIPGSNYDVFLSFRGEDTRHSFTDHLYEAFISKGIEAFRDSEKLQLGQEIAPALIQAIETSQYAIVVFSEKYADSKWCLEELAKIVECRENKGLKVVPVFYHVDPSDVRKQTGPFEKAFDEHQKNDKIDREKIQKWKDAMREVGNLSGEHLLPHLRYEAECIQNIVKVILNKLDNTFSAHTFSELIGMESRVEKLKSHLAMESNDVHIIGIWGTGGMGKTTLARVVYDMISSKFEACSFIANIREESKKCGLHKIQQILLRELLNDRDLKVHNVHNGVLMIKRRLRNKKIILVLDDVNELDQWKMLAGEHCWFGSGSRVIITTRDRDLLKLPEVNTIYEAEVLNHDEALKLFSLKAFKMDHPTEDYGKLSQAFVDYCKGLPLALEVLGSFLFKKSIDEWKSELDRLMIEFCDRGILNVLQISFDGLQPKEKNIFLNIACFFNHKKEDDVIKILDYLELYPKIGLRVLIDKSLIKVHKKQLWMHDLLQDMGRHIVCQECPNDPRKRSRLWSFEEIDNVLTKNTGTEAIQGIVLELHEPKKVYWNPEAFSKMGDLKLLKICGVQLMHDLKHLPSSLRVLDWKEYPPKSLTSSFLSKCFENLKFITLKLTEGPDIIDVPNLKSLVLENCINLRRIHRSIRIHKMLTILNLHGCENLTSLPSKFEMECLEELNLRWCSKIKKIPEFGRNMKRLCSLYLSGTAITTLPTSIEHLTDLSDLDLSYSNLVCLPESIIQLSKLIRMNLNNCKSLRSLPKLPLNIVQVEANCCSLKMLPDPLKPSDSLEPSLYLIYCFQFSDIQSCMDKFISGIKKYPKLSPSRSLLFPEKKYNIVIPGSEIPEWFSHQSMRDEVKIKQPSHLCKEVGIAICIVFHTNCYVRFPTICYSLIANGKRIYIDSSTSIAMVSSDHLWLVYLTPQFFDEESNKLLWEGDVNGFSQIRIKIEAAFPGSLVKKWGIRMIYKKDIEDLDRTMVQYSNSKIIAYDGNSDSEESSEYKDCDEELSDRDESNDNSDEDNLEEDDDNLDESSVDWGKYSETDLDD